MNALTDPTLWMALPIAGLLVDDKDIIYGANFAAESFLNLSQKNLRGKKLWDRLAIDAQLDQAFARVRNASAPLLIHDIIVRSGQSAPIIYDVHIAPLMEPEGHILVLLHYREIAERIGRAHFSQSAAKSAVGMAQMLAHEIKNPLAGISGAAQLLSMGLEGDDLELTDLIVDETRRVVKLLEQFEQFGNLSVPQRKTTNIHDILNQARKSAELGFAAHMRFVENYDPSLPSTYVDPDQFVQVFLNVLKNAAQVGQEDGIITLKTFYQPSLHVRKGDGTKNALPLQVEICDNGPGIAPEIAEDIFEPFVSGRENGTGLGLALVSKIISDHSGWITVNSTPGYTVFRVSLPIARSEAMADNE